MLALYSNQMEKKALMAFQQLTVCTVHAGKQWVNHPTRLPNGNEEETSSISQNLMNGLSEVM